MALCRPLVQRWKTFLCWLGSHDHQCVIDCDARKSFQRCTRCGYEFQYDFQVALTPAWIGFCMDGHRCPICGGWKPKDWDRCANEICEMNPDGPLRVHQDGTIGPMLDSRH